MVWRFLVLLSCIYVLGETGAVRYDGHRVLKVEPRTLAEYDMVSKLQNTLQEQYADIWRRSNGVGSDLIFRVSPEKYPPTERWMTDNRLQHRVMIKDVQEAADKQRTSSATTTIGAIDFDYGKYHDWDEINRWIDDIAAEYSTIVKVFTASKTLEGREVRGLQIKTNSNTSRPGIWYQGGIHAREWVSPATVMYITAKMLEKYESRSDVKKILDAFEIFVVPVLNADGYVFSWTNDRMWRKTRSKHGLCHGVDGNRNYGFHWGNSSGSSSDPCSEMYRGPRAFSEPVIRGVTDYIKSRSVTFKAFIDFHSFSELWMTAWGYTQKTPSDLEQQNESSKAAVNAIKSVHGVQYKYGPIATTIYVANGDAVDWAYGSMGIKYAATPELRDKGVYGFLLPADQIVPCGEETLEGFLAFADYVLSH